MAGLSHFVHCEFFPSKEKSGLSTLDKILVIIRFLKSLIWSSKLPEGFGRGRGGVNDQWFKCQLKGMHQSADFQVLFLWIVSLSRSKWSLMGSWDWWSHQKHAPLVITSFSPSPTHHPSLHPLPPSLQVSFHALPRLTQDHQPSPTPFLEIESWPCLLSRGGKVVTVLLHHDGVGRM